MAEIKGSILDSTKRLVNIDPESTEYDAELIMHINTTFFVLEQLGIGPTNGFSIEDNTTLWSEFVGEDQIKAVESYMGLSVRLLFDPPPTGPATEAVERQLSKLEWRLNFKMEGVRWESAQQTSL